MSAVKRITCAEAVQRLYEYLDGEGSTENIEEIEIHLENCRRCCDRFTFEEALWRTVKTKGSQAQCPADLKVRVLELIRQY